MSDQERGAYAPPTDAPLSFDPREPVRGASGPPYALIISALVLAAVVAAVFVFYRSGVREAGDAPRTVGEPVGALKAAPPNEAQPQDPAAGLQIYRSEPGEAPEAVAAQPQFAPPPEQPQPRAQLPTVVAAPLPPAAPKAAPAPKAVTPAPLPVAKIAPTPAPAPKVAPTSAPKVAEAPKPAATSGGVGVQVGAVSSTALADKVWKEAVSVAPGLAMGKGKAVEKVERDGATLYRSIVTGFADKAAGNAFCDKLKASGKSCIVR